MPPQTRHRAARRRLWLVVARTLARRPPALGAVALIAAVAGALAAAIASAAGAAGFVPADEALSFAVTIATISATGAAAVLLRLALRIHTRAHSFGPCRGAGYLGLGTAIAAATAAAGGLLAAAAEPSAATIAVQVGTVATAASYVTGLLLLPGAVPTFAARLRHGLDATGVGSATFLVAWLLLLAPPATRPPAGAQVLVGLLASVAIALTVITGLRAARHRRAALACAGGAALVMIGLTLPALGRDEAGWLVAAGLALAAGPPLIVVGARRADDGPAIRPPPATGGLLAAQPLLAVPVAAAIGATAYHLLTGGHFDRVASAVGLGLVSTVAVRETLAALDVRRYAGRLAEQQARFRALVGGSADVTMVLDTDLVVRWQSPAAARQLGLSDQDVLDRPFPDLVHPDDADEVTARLAAVLTAAQPPDNPPVRARLRDGFGDWRETESTVRDLRAAPEVGALVVHVRDVGDLAGLKRRLDEATRTDPLTGLPNERRLVELATSRLAAGTRGAVVVVTLHGLAGVNELSGTAVGDEVLMAAADRIRGGSTGADVAARLPGNRFAVLMACSALRAYPRATRLVAAVAEPYDLSCGGHARLTAGAGVADLHGATRAEEVLHHAGVAAERARQRGPGRAEGYDDGLAAALRRRAAIEQRLAAAIDAGTFDLVYQPVLDLVRRQPVAVEALLRWRLPEFGAVSPAEVVAAAEELGCAVELDTRVLRRACHQLARWRRDGHDVAMAVNVSPRQLTGDTLPELVSDALRRNDLPPDRLIVEVAARDVPDDAAPAPLAALRSLGARVALDHFGTGTLGLARLPGLPVDLVKFDRSLFADRDTALVDVMVGLGGRLGFVVAAVGVETDAELATLRAAGCHTAQGNVLAAPAHAERVEAFLEEGRAKLL